MSDLVLISKANEEVSNYPCWISCTDSKGILLKPLICCKCGVYCSIGNHHVHSDGRVTASFYHKKIEGQPKDHEGCEWHVFLKLENYDLGEFLPD